MTSALAFITPGDIMQLPHKSYRSVSNSQVVTGTAAQWSTTACSFCGLVVEETR